MRKVDLPKSFTPAPLLVNGWAGIYMSLWDNKAFFLGLYAVSWSSSKTFMSFKMLRKITKKEKK